MNILEFDVTGQSRRNVALISEDIDLRLPFDDLENQTARAGSFGKCLNVGNEIGQGEGRCQTGNKDLKRRRFSAMDANGCSRPTTIQWPAV